MTTLNEPALALARDALRAAEREVPRYSHARSPRTYTQHQLFALLAVRRFLGTDLRTVAGMASDSPALRATLGLERAPHYSTLCYAERRLIEEGPHGVLLRDLVARARGAGPGESGAFRENPRGDEASASLAWPGGPAVRPLVAGPSRPADPVPRPPRPPHLPS